MILELSNGKTINQNPAEHIILPTVADDKFDVDDANTWECDRASIFARVGQRIWTGQGNEIATIVRVF